jgi:hypothetical protein
MSDFLTVFVISRHTELTYGTGAIAGLVVVLIGILGQIHVIPWWKRDRPAALVIVGGAILLTASAALFVGGLLQTGRLVSLYESGEFQVAEGVVHVMHQQAYHGHDKGDLIRIGDTEFEIDAFRLSYGYDRIIAHGGVLRDGVYARVYYHDDAILRIDIRQEQSNENKTPPEGERRNKG